jgi:hypothetical protein
MIQFNSISCKQGNNQKSIINADLNELNEEYIELQNEFKYNPENSTIKNALISNYRMRIDILDMIIIRLKNYC